MNEQPYKGFDSILVRLKVNISAVTAKRHLQFRFHTGSIKSTHSISLNGH